MSQPSKVFFKRHFQSGDMPLLGELYKSVTAKDNATFWWVGDEDNWNNVYCAFEDGKMVAKGQVSIINIVPPGRSKENNHSIYLPLNCLYRMRRDLIKPIPEIKLQEEFQFAYWKMETSSEERDYLGVDAEIWPDTPLGLNRLSEYKKNKLWTSMVIRHTDAIVGGLMAWQEEDHGVIEDVFVREPWRKRGIAKYLLTHALKYLKANHLQYAHLMVLTTNKSAWSLYESVGFYADKEEIRYFTMLD